MNLSPVFEVFIVLYDGDIEIVFDSYQEALNYINEMDDANLYIVNMDVWDNAEVHLT